MNNYWINLGKIRDAVDTISMLLNDEFKGETAEPTKWIIFIEEIVDVLYSGDIMIMNGLLRYEVICEVDQLGLIEKLELSEI